VCPPSMAYDPVIKDCAECVIYDCSSASGRDYNRPICDQCNGNFHGKQCSRPVKKFSLIRLFSSLLLLFVLLVRCKSFGYLPIMNFSPLQTLRCR